MKIRTAAPVLAATLAAATTAACGSDTTGRRPVKNLSDVGIERVTDIPRVDEDIRITATGRVPSGGWRDARLRTVRRDAGTGTVVLSLTAVPPDGPATAVMADVRASTVLDVPAGFDVRRIVVRSGGETIEVNAPQ